MATYGRQVLATTGIPVMALADLSDVEWKAGGVTIDWSLITAVSSDTTLADGTVIPNGQKGIEFGTILCATEVQEVQTVTVTGSPTGGTYKLAGNSAVTATIAYNASAATFQSALRALGGSFAGVVVSGSAGGPYTLTYPVGAGDVAAPTLDTNSLTGGSSPSVSFATGTAGTNTGTYGPYDSAATDGRQSLNRGYCFILNESVLQVGAMGLAGVASDHPAVFDGGTVWKARLKVGGQNPTYLGSGSQPSWSAFETAFPDIHYVTS